MLEHTILSHLLHNEEYARKVIPFLKPDYFHEKSQQIIFDILNTYVQKFNSFPSKESCYIDLSNRGDLNEDIFKECKVCIQALEPDTKTQTPWLLEQTEKWCQEKALHNAIHQSIIILKDKDAVLGKGAIPKLLSDALAVSFDSNIGHDYLEDYLSRYEFYQSKEDKIPFDLEYLNIVTDGGVSKKTLNIFLAGTSVGKSLVMGHLAADHLVKGYNVLYLTLEMSEQQIAKRLDANIVNIRLKELAKVNRDRFSNTFIDLKTKTAGKLIIKEYPPTQAGASHFRYVINELRIKKNFIPDIIYVDYINLCASSRMKIGNVNSYSYIKAVAEEIRGLASEFNLPIISATQTNRSGFTNSDPGLEDTSDSFGLPMTADFMVALTTDDTLRKLGQMMVKQLKNRYADVSYYKRFVIGVDYDKMRLFNTEQTAQEDIVDDTPVMDNTGFGSRLDEEAGKPDFPRKMFESFK